MYRSVSIAAAAIVATVFSQAPEFAQQYQQRIGGAIGELEPIVANFDADAQRSDLTRAEALEIYGRSHEQFLKDRGKSMAEIFERYDALVRHREQLARTGELYRPLVLAYTGDAKLVGDTRRDFVLAVPISFSGIFYAVTGFILTILSATGLLGLVRRRRRARRTSDL